MNLVVNACDAMPSGGTLTIETTNVNLDEAYVRKYAVALPPGRYVMLAVSDTGHGMETETLEKIFEPFFTTKELGRGTGLGLATVFGIVKQHGGNIWVYSEPGCGTTFKIYLPQEKDSVPDIQSPELNSQSYSGAETILVVEDEEMVSSLVSETLEAHGYRVLQASDPAEGIEIASVFEDRIDLLLTDVIMPGMNGRKLYDHIAAIYPEICVLFMSGYTDSVIVDQGVLVRGLNFIQKPFSVHRLTHKVREVLERASPSG